jgi:hypothetical protein
VAFKKICIFGLVYIGLPTAHHLEYRRADPGAFQAIANEFARLGASTAKPLV